MFRMLVFISVFAAFGAIPAVAWDDIGHKVTAYIAWQQMSQPTRERVIAILRRAPEDSHLSALYRSYGAQPESARKREFFMVSSTWADIIRDRGFPVRNKKYHKGNWHYSDTFWRQENGRAVILPEMEGGGEGVMRLFEAEKILRSAISTDAEKAIAIAWFLHIGGDLHQPLHTSARVTATEPKGDQGGNLFLLTPAGTARENQVNLHWYWDSIISRKMPIKGEQCDPEYIEPIAEKIMRKHRAGEISGEFHLGDYNEWQQGSFRLNPDLGFSADLLRNQMPSKKYLKRAYKASERQFALAGYRLGKTLENIFGTPVNAETETK